MRLIGCDLHASQQSIAMLDRDTGVVVEQTLAHEGGSCSTPTMSPAVRCGETVAAALAAIRTLVDPSAAFAGATRLSDVDDPARCSHWNADQMPGIDGKRRLHVAKILLCRDGQRRALSLRLHPCRLWRRTEIRQGLSTGRHGLQTRTPPRPEDLIERAVIVAAADTSSPVRSRRVGIDRSKAHAHAASTDCSA